MDVDADTDGRARARIKAHRFTLRHIAAALQPDEVLTLTEWVKKNVYIPDGRPYPGPFDPGMVPAAAPIYDEWSNPDTREIIIRGPVQTLKSALMINALLYEAATFPGPFAVYQPDKMLAKNFSQDRIPELAKGTKMEPYFSRTVRGRPTTNASGGTIGERVFPGGTCLIAGVRDTSALISRSFRIVFIDEIAAMLDTDVIGATTGRMTAFPDSRRFVASSPGEVGTCKITAEYERGDQREWNARCPHCGEFQPLEWERVRFHPRDPKSARYECSDCGTLWDDADREAANRAGKYFAAEEFNGIASFSLNALASPMQSMPELAQEWTDAITQLESTGDISKVITFTKSRMALPWADKTRRLEAEEIKRTCSVKYPADDIAPDGVVAVTVAVDVQDDRLEAEVCGWGIADIDADDLKLIRAVGGQPAADTDETRHAIRRWGLAYHVISGDPTAPDVWRRLEDIYNTDIYLAPGVRTTAAIMVVDIGGHHTHAVREFVAGRGAGRDNIVPIKGANTTDAAIIRRSTNRDMLEKYANELWHVGTFAIKEIVYRHLAASRHMTAKTKLYSFPRGGACGYTDHYFTSLTSEEKVNRRNRDGQVRPAWVCAAGRGNEALDCAVYNFAAINIMGGAAYLDRQRAAVAARIHRA